MTLSSLATERSELVELIGALDAIGHDRQVERASQGEDGANDGGVLWVAAEPGDEGVVDLEDVDGEAAEVGKRGVPGAEVVDGDVDADGFERLQGADSHVDVVHQHAFG